MTSNSGHLADSRNYGSGSSIGLVRLRAESRTRPDHIDVARLVSRMRQELHGLLGEYDEIARKIESGEKVINGLVGMLARRSDSVPLVRGPSHSVCSTGSTARFVLTNQCRIILMNSPNPITIGEICTQLTQGRTPRRKHRVRLEEVCMILHHLRGSGEAQATVYDGLRKWIWTGKEADRVDTAGVTKNRLLKDF